MKIFLTFIFVILLISPTFAQRTAAVRGVGTQTCKTLNASNQADKQFALQSAQWILGNMTGHFRQTGDDPSRTLGDDIVVRTVLEICSRNPDKTIDDAVTIAISSFPATEVKKPGELK
jgi:hypothetical protein